MKKKFYVSYVYVNYSGEKVFNNAMVLINVPENKEKQIPVLLRQKLFDKINETPYCGSLLPVTIINFWEID